jgi:hypothetical protein
MSGSADPLEAIAERLAQKAEKLDDAQKIKAAFHSLTDPAVWMLLRGLQAEGITDVDGWLAEQAIPLAGARDAAIRRLLAEGVAPGRTIRWKVFCDRVRDECKGWTGEGPKRTPAWGFNDRTIKDVVRHVKKI